MKKTIQVAKAFLLTLEDRTTRAFAKGLHEVEEHIANHWYVEAHATVVETVENLEAKAEQVADAAADEAAAAAVDAALAAAKKPAKK